MSAARIRTEETRTTIAPARAPGRKVVHAPAMAPQAAYRRIQLNNDRPRPANLLALQRTVGNRTVQRMVAQRVDHTDDGGTNQPVIQRTPIGTGHGYSATNSSKFFPINHLAADADKAKLASQSRVATEKGTTENTVIIGVSDDDVKKLVLAADWDAAEWISGSVYRVVVSVNHVIHHLLVGTESTTIDEKRTEGPRVGLVPLKVYFNTREKTISIAGITT